MASHAVDGKVLRCLGGRKRVELTPRVGEDRTSMTEPPRAPTEHLKMQAVVDQATISQMIDQTVPRG